MKADYVTYRRATTVSLLGLAVQLVLGLAFLILSILGNDRASQTASAWILSGSIVWLTLAIVFDQHRRERIEAMEAEELRRSGARDASVFGEDDEELRVAAKRLAWMHKVLMPAVSMVFALLLAGFGWWGLSRAAQMPEYTGLFTGTDEQGWTIGFGVVLSVIGFVFARYVSGMSKSRVWRNLRAGAAQAAAASLIGLATLVGQFSFLAGTDAVLLILPWAIPIAMLLFAGEVVLNFVLEVYRPRKPGEFPRPAFDSRVLGFIAAPDRIAESVGGALSYQFGIDITGSYFYELFKKYAGWMVIGGAAVLGLLTTVGVVQPNQQGLLLSFGALKQDAEPLGPGPVLKRPWPFQTLETFDTETLRSLDLGAGKPTVEGAWLWTNAHGQDSEPTFIVQPAQFEQDLDLDDVDAQSGRDVSLIVAEIPLEFTVRDFRKWETFADPERREDLLKGVAQQVLTQNLLDERVDKLLGSERESVSRELASKIRASIEALDAGVDVTFVGIEGLHPPKDTALSFEALINTDARRQTQIENARKEANTMLIKAAGSIEKAREIAREIRERDILLERGQTEAVEAKEMHIESLLASAGGEAASLIQVARGERWNKHMSARARAVLYEGQLAAYNASPGYYLTSLYYDAMSDVLGNARVFLVGDPDTEIRMDMHDELDPTSRMFAEQNIEGEQ